MVTLDIDPATVMTHTIGAGRPRARPVGGPSHISMKAAPKTASRGKLLSSYRVGRCGAPGPCALVGLVGGFAAVQRSSGPVKYRRERNEPLRVWNRDIGWE
jgi:hypothetical protein